MRLKSKSLSKTRVYTITGLEIFEDDIPMLKNGDLLVLACNGEDYAPEQILE